MRCTTSLSSAARTKRCVDVRLTEVPMEDWAVALKGTEALLRRSIYAVMPKRQAQQLEAITAASGASAGQPYRTDPP